MSILIERLTVVARRSEVYLSYPGGEESFFADVEQLERPPRFICSSDPILINISFENAEHARPLIALLTNAKFVGVDERSGEYVDFAVLSETSGPLAPAPWLAWKRHALGFTMAWDIYEEIGDLAAPSGWTPKLSRGLKSSAAGGRETEVDPLRDSPPHDSEAPLPQAESTYSPGIVSAAEWTGNLGISKNASPLFHSLEYALDQKGWVPIQIATPVAVIELPAARGPYRCRYVVREDLNLISCATAAPLGIPEKGFLSAMEFIARVNATLQFGCFDFNVDRGELAFRAGLYSKGAMPTPDMIAYLAETGVAEFERWYPMFFDMIDKIRSPDEASMDLEP